MKVIFWAINIENFSKKQFKGSIQEQIDIVLDLGGIPIIAHPYWRGGLGSKIFELKRVLGYEMINQSSPFGSARLIKESMKNQENKELYSKFGKYSGSDSHGCMAYGHFYNYVKADSKNKEDILEALFKMRVKPHWSGLFDTLRLFFLDGAPNQIYQLRKIINKGKDIRY